MIDTLKKYPGYLLRRASASLIADLTERLEPLELRTSEASTLMLIKANSGVTPSQIGRALDIQRANMTPLIRRLEDRGLISRQPVNGRSQGLTLTPDGETLMVEVHSIVDVYEADLMARVPEPLQPHVIPVLLALFGKRK